MRKYPTKRNIHSQIKSKKKFFRKTLIARLNKKVKEKMINQLENQDANEKIKKLQTENLFEITK